MAKKKYIIIILFILVVVIFHYWNKAKNLEYNYKEQYIKFTKINKFIPLEELSIISGKFISDEKIILSDIWCGIYIFNMKKNKIEKIIRQNNNKALITDFEAESYENVYYISESKNYLIVLDCDPLGRGISIYSLKDYENILNLKFKMFLRFTIYKNIAISNDDNFLYVIGDFPLKQFPLVSSGKMAFEKWDLKAKKRLNYIEINSYNFEKILMNYKYIIFCKGYLSDGKSIKIYDIDKFKLIKELTLNKYIKCEDLILEDDKIIYFEIASYKDNYGIEKLNMNYYDIGEERIYNLLLDLAPSSELIAFLQNRYIIFKQREYLGKGENWGKYQKEHIKYYDIKQKNISRYYTLPLYNCLLEDIADNGKTLFIKCLKGRKKDKPFNPFGPNALIIDYYIGHLE